MLSNTASTADPDFDGLTNAMEYAVGFDPRFSSPSPGVITNNGMTITFTKGALAKVDPKVTYQIETSISLGVLPTPWTVNVANVTNGPDTIAITFPAGPAKDFARLKVTLAQMASDILLGRITGLRVGPAANILLPTRLLIRSSTGRPPASKVRNSSDKEK